MGSEGEMERLNELLTRLEADERAASERADLIEEESSGIPDHGSRLEAARWEVTELRERIDEAQAAWQSAQDDWLSGAEDDDEEEDGDEGERLSVYDAADIWNSRGRDEDYMSGYTEEELRRASEE